MNDFLYGANCLQFMYVVKWRRQKKNADMIMQGSCCKLVINVISFNPKKVKMIKIGENSFHEEDKITLFAHPRRRKRVSTNVRYLIKKKKKSSTH